MKLRPNGESERQYRKTLQTLPKYHSGDEAEVITTWEHFSDMSFLREIMTPRQSSGNLIESSSCTLEPLMVRPFIQFFNK